MTWNTTTAPIDRERIRKALLYPAAKITVNQIQTAMDRITLESPESISSIQSLLDKLDDIDDLILTANSDSSYAMIRADVVEWEGGGKRTAGLWVERNGVIQELSSTLSLAPYQMAGNSNNSGMLLRS